MQTFLPYSDFVKSAKVLDNKRLGKQRVEAWQIYRSLTESKYGWKNHPAVKMWKGHELALLLYGICICAEWRSRGFMDTMMDKFVNAIPNHSLNCEEPPWLGRHDLHRSHRSNLFRKDPGHYFPMFEQDLPDNLEYVWPK